MPRPRKPNIIQRQKVRAYFEGVKKAESVAIPALERKYRVALLWRFWVALGAAFGLGVATGAALYEAWVSLGG